MTTPPPVSRYHPLHFRNADTVATEEEEEVGSTVDDDEALNDYDTIEDMASFLTLRVGMAMLRRQLKQKQKQNEQAQAQQAPFELPVDELESSMEPSIDGKEARADSVSRMPPCIATDFGRPLDVHQDGIPPLALHAAFAQVLQEESKDLAPVVESSPAKVSMAPTDSTADAVSEVIPPPLEPTPVTTKNVIATESSSAEESVAPTDNTVYAVSEVIPPSVEPTPVTTKNVIATDFGRPLDVVEDNIPALQNPLAQVQPEESKDPAPFIESSPAKGSVAPSDSAVDAVTELIPLSVEPTPVTTKDASVEPTPVTTENVIATDFGRPLDVVQQGIPPLQDSFAQVQGEASKDTVSSPASSTTDTASTAAAAVTIDEADTSSGDSNVLAPSDVSPQAADSPPISVETKKASSEAKQRALLVARLEQEQRQKGKVRSRETPSTFIKDEGASFVMMGDQLPNSKEDSKTPRGSTELKMKVAEAVDEEVSRASATVTESEPEDVIPDRQTAVTLAREQPKSPEEEKKLQERYGSMPLQERAFTILYDLGMIETNLNPDDPDYDHFNDDEMYL
jgi:hypothetical protein